MDYVKFNLRAELGKVAQGKEPDVDPLILLKWIAADYLELTAKTPTAEEPRDDSTAFLTRLYHLRDRRG